MGRVLDLFLCAMLLSACGGSDDGSSPAGSGGEANDSGLEQPIDADTVDPFNGMCSTARWSHVSSECWACWCTQCADTLNGATRRSLEIFECMFDEQLLVNSAPELACEVRAGTQACVDGDTAEWDKLVSFDICLMQQAVAPAFRACEAECGVTYPGDVCARYP